MKSPTSLNASPATGRLPARSYLTPDAVLAVFRVRPPRTASGVFIPSTASSRALAEKYNISDKTVRDIWNRKCWAKVTRPLWTDAETIAEGLQRASSPSSPSSVVPAKTRAPGRPKGAKDTVLRRKRLGDQAVLTPEAALLSHASMPASAHAPTPCPCEIGANRATIAGEEEEFADPFIGEWDLTMTSIDLTTMVFVQELMQAGEACILERPWQACV